MYFQKSHIILSTNVLIRRLVLLGGSTETAHFVALSRLAGQKNGFTGKTYMKSAAALTCGALSLETSWPGLSRSPR